MDHRAGMHAQPSASSHRTCRAELHRHKVGAVRHQEVSHLQRRHAQPPRARRRRQAGGKGLQAQRGAQLQRGQAQLQQLLAQQRVQPPRLLHLLTLQLCGPGGGGWGWCVCVWVGGCVGVWVGVWVVVVGGGRAGGAGEVLT